MDGVFALVDSDLRDAGEGEGMAAHVVLGGLRGVEAARRVEKKLDKAMAVER